MLNFLKSLFQRSDDARPSGNSASRDIDATVPLPELSTKQLHPETAKGPRPAIPRSYERLVVGLAQDVGRVRDHNEDVLLAFTGELAGLDPMPGFGLFVVADGMGGHSLGERASGVAARTMAQIVLDQILPSLLADPMSDPERPLLAEVMENAMAAANNAVIQSVPEGGTTLTCALVLGEQVITSHVGDSRIYIINGDVCEQITRDHSLVQRLKELGQLTDDEAAVHPQRSVLYKAIGQGDGLEADIVSRRLAPGSFLLLCSDGMWGQVPDHIIMQIVRQSQSVQAACEALVVAANEAGGPDNITAVMVQIPG